MESSSSTDQIQLPAGTSAGELPTAAKAAPPLASRLLKRDAKHQALALLKTKDNPIAEGENRF